MAFEPQTIPAPVQPISYMTPAEDHRRPGILTAVGVLSIVLGGFGALASISGIVTAMMYMTMSRMTFPVPPPAPGTARISTTSPAMTTATSSAGVVTTAYSPPPFRFNVSRGASILTGVESAISLLVAVFLFTAGILMLRDSPRAARMHWIYIMLKVPLIAVAAVATWWTYTGLMSNLNSFSPGGRAISPVFSNAMMIVPAIMSAFFSLIYPVALMIVLSTRTAKHHFQTLSPGVVQ